MTALHPNSYELIRPLLLGMDFHLVGRSILAKQTPAQIFVDNHEHPKTLFAQAGHRYILAGDPEIDSFNLGIKKMFANVIYPRALAAGQEGFAVYYDSPAWEEKMDALLADKEIIHADREYYACKKLSHKWQDFMPEGFQIQMVDADLLANSDLKHLETLKEEMASERPVWRIFSPKVSACARSTKTNLQAGVSPNTTRMAAVRSASRPPATIVNAALAQRSLWLFLNMPFHMASKKLDGTAPKETNRRQRRRAKQASTKSAVTNPTLYYLRLRQFKIFSH